MDVIYNLNLSKFSTEELRSLFNDGAISRAEYLNELVSRKEKEANRKVETNQLERMMEQVRSK